jgi:hypothetical protein
MKPRRNNKAMWQHCQQRSRVGDCCGTPLWRGGVRIWMEAQIKVGDGQRYDPPLPKHTEFIVVMFREVGQNRTTTTHPNTVGVPGYIDTIL